MQYSFVRNYPLKSFPLSQQSSGFYLCPLEKSLTERFKTHILIWHLILECIMVLELTVPF